MNVAREIYDSSDVIDLHIDSFIWARLFGYDITKRHGRGLFGARFYSQVDLPRIREAKVTGAIWSITTNPLRPDKDAAFAQNLREMKALFARVPQDARLCKSYADYMRCKADGAHAVFLGVQGGNAVEEDLTALDDTILRVTLVHLTTSTLGITSSPLNAGSRRGLTDFGREYVRHLNQQRIFVDLAHINREGFFDAVAVHDKGQPLIVTHTGIKGVHDHWRNLDDAQIKTIADTGGTIGVMYQSSFLGDSVFGGKAESVVRHLEHIIKVVGDEHASLGSDWDGMIVTPRDMPTCLELPRLVEIMLERGWPEGRIRKVLGGNFLRALQQLRPEA